MSSMDFPAAADIRLLHDAIGHDVLRDTIADDPTFVKHDQAPAAAHHLFEIMFDQDDGDPLSVHGGNGLDLLRSFGLVESGERLIEQDDLRIDGECARDFEPLHLTKRQRARELAAGPAQADLHQNIGGTFALAIAA